MDPDASDVARARLSADTSRDIEERQAEAWRGLSSIDVARTVNAACSAGFQIAWFSLKDRFPAASDDELRVRLAALMLGPDLAARIYPDSAPLLGR